jgi:hypothetical protein
MYRFFLKKGRINLFRVPLYALNPCPKVKTGKNTEKHSPCFLKTRSIARTKKIKKQAFYNFCGRRSSEKNRPHPPKTVRGVVFSLGIMALRSGFCRTKSTFFCEGKRHIKRQSTFLRLESGFFLV